MPDFHQSIIDEFRAHDGKVGGPFEGETLLLLHTVGARTGQPRVNPVAYQDIGDGVAVFASKGGAPTNPDWYYNLTAAGNGSVERGTETHKVSVHELTGAERDRIYAEQARRYPGFAEYERQTAGIRTIPVLELRRA